MPYGPTGQEKLAVANATLMAIRETVVFSPNLSILQFNKTFQEELREQYYRNVEQCKADNDYLEFLHRCLTNNNGLCNELVDIAYYLLKNFELLPKGVFFKRIHLYHEKSSFRHSFAIFHAAYYMTRLPPNNLKELFSAYNPNDIIFDPWLWCTCLVKDYPSLLSRAEEFEVEDRYMGVPIKIPDSISKKNTFSSPLFAKLAGSFQKYYSECKKVISGGMRISCICAPPKEITDYTEKRYNLSLIAMEEERTRKALENEWHCHYPQYQSDA